MLEVTGLSAGYDGLHVLQGVSLHVARGEAVCIIGANGAGKTTLMRCLAGLVRPSAGTVRVGGEDVLRRPAARRVVAGLALVPEGRRVFAPMTVLENLEMGAFTRNWLRRDPCLSEDLDRVFALFPRLRERRSQAAGLLSGGEQQMLAIGRALMSRPRLLLLDEPSMGLAPLVIEEIFATVAQLNADGTAVLLAEQNAVTALRSTVRGYVLAEGAITQQGASRDLAHDPAVRAAYLGL